MPQYFCCCMLLSDKRGLLFLTCAPCQIYCRLLSAGTSRFSTDNLGWRGPGPGTSGSSNTVSTCASCTGQVGDRGCGCNSANPTQPSRTRMHGRARMRAAATPALPRRSPGFSRVPVSLPSPLRSSRPPTSSPRLLTPRPTGALWGGPKRVLACAGHVFGLAGGAGDRRRGWAGGPGDRNAPSTHSHPPRRRARARTDSNGKERLLEREGAAPRKGWREGSKGRDFVVTARPVKEHDVAIQSGALDSQGRRLFGLVGGPCAYPSLQAAATANAVIGRAVERSPLLCTAPSVGLAFGVRGRAWSPLSRPLPG